jgi:hypothetical protein
MIEEFKEIFGADFRYTIMPTELVRSVGRVKASILGELLKRWIEGGKKIFKCDEGDEYPYFNANYEDIARCLVIDISDLRKHLKELDFYVRSAKFELEHTRQFVLLMVHIKALLQDGRKKREIKN